MHVLYVFTGFNLLLAIGLLGKLLGFCKENSYKQHFHVAKDL